MGEQNWRQRLKQKAISKVLREPRPWSTAGKVTFGASVILGAAVSVLARVAWDFAGRRVTSTEGMVAQLQILVGVFEVIVVLLIGLATVYYAMRTGELVRLTAERSESERRRDYERRSEEAAFAIARATLQAEIDSLTAPHQLDEAFKRFQVSALSDGPAIRDPELRDRMESLVALFVEVAYSGNTTHNLDSEEGEVGMRPDHNQLRKLRDSLLAVRRDMQAHRNGEPLGPRQVPSLERIGEWLEASISAPGSQFI